MTTMIGFTAPVSASKRILTDAWKLWEEELRNGVDGQDQMRTGTWTSNALHRAVCCEASAREWDAIGCAGAAEAWRDQGVAYLTEGL